MTGFDGPTIAVGFEGVTFQVDPARPETPARFVLGVRKSGSSMFNRVAKLMAKFNRVNFLTIPDDLFANNVPVDRWIVARPPPGLLAGGNVYGGFRDFPAAIADDPVFRDAIKVLLVRDPRDALVSEYFSVAYNHMIPPETGEVGAREDMLARRAAAQQASIDDFARAQAAHMAETFAEYMPLLDDDRLLLLRYEDVIFDKARMIRDVAAHFGWTILPRQVDAILKWVDVVPDREDPTAFIRKVIPGDHRDKLSPATIAAIDRELAPAMRGFGYR